MEAQDLLTQPMDSTDDDPPSSRFAFRFPESIVHAIDRQIISSGLRLIMFLPAFAIVTYFASWAFSQSSPAWWLNNIEPNIGMGFSTAMVSLTFVVLIGFHSFSSSP